MGKLGHYAFRRRKSLAIGAVVVAVVAALGGSTVFDNVKPFGFQDPNSESSRAYEDLRDATGERLLPEVELLVEPSSGGTRREPPRAARELRRVDGIRAGRNSRSAIPSWSRPTDGSALVLGFISADVDGHLRGRSGRQATGSPMTPESRSAGAAVTVDELTTTTEDDLKRIELYALPLLLLLSLLVFRGLVAALLPVAVGALSILTTLLLLNALTTVIDIDTFAINIVTGLGLGLAIDYSLFLVTRFREELDQRGAIEALAGRDHCGDRQDGPLQRPDGRRLADRALHLPAAIPLLDRDRWRPGRPLLSRGLPPLPARPARPARRTGERAGADSPAGRAERAALVRHSALRAHPPGQRCDLRDRA